MNPIGPRSAVAGCLHAAVVAAAPAFRAGDGTAQDRGPRIYITVDTEGISGVGTPATTSASGKDYGLARRLMYRFVRE